MATKINLTNVVIGIGAGAVDEVLEWQDSQRGYAEPFKNLTDWGRVILLGLGFLGQTMNFYPEPAAALAQSELPLVTKSVGNVVRSMMGGGVTSRTIYSHPATSSPKAKVGWRPLRVE